MTFDGYRQKVNPLASEYSAFGVCDRLLFTGHSHQAWPDASRAAQSKAWDLAAQHIDDKWGPAFEVADQLRSHISYWLGGVDSNQIALGQNTFELVYRWLSCFDQQTLHIVTTDSEFHTVRRLRQALEPKGVRFTVVASEPLHTFGDRFTEAIDGSVTAAIVSHTFFNSGYRNPDLAKVSDHCAKQNISLLVDLYHTIGNYPFDAKKEGLDSAFLVGGGYKYLQWGEGNCFLAVPKNTTLKPSFTGWYAEFDRLTNAPGEMYYSDKGSFRFAGATYDITANLRAVAVAEFFASQGLTKDALAASYGYQLDYLEQGITAANLDKNKVSLLKLPAQQRSAFLVLECEDAASLHKRLNNRGILTDYRGNRLRIGPAPYLNTQQLDTMIDAVKVECS